MPITTIDTTTALLVIDLQEGLAQVSTIHPLRSVASRAGELADAFRDRGMPVVLVNVIGGGSTEMLPELRRRPSDHVVTKSQVSAFHTGTGLAEHLTALGVTHVVIAGVSTSKGVEATARDAHAHGFQVTIAGDAVTDRSQHAHHNSLHRAFPRLGHVRTAVEIIAALPERSPHNKETR
jgi:nicotinamidase-related amidase